MTRRYTLAAAFFIPLAFYLWTLAPTVTFEDSGELIAAAYHLGVPHQPGYPLFTLVGRVFTLLPFGEVAWRVNLMSAVTAAAGMMFICWAVLLLIAELPGISPVNGGGANRSHRYLAEICGLMAALWAGLSFENWEQSIITEVYGLNTLFIGVVLFLAVRWRQAAGVLKRSRYFLLICFCLGLTFSNHTTSLMLLPVLLLFAAVEDVSFFKTPALWPAGCGALLTGLLPYVYLPLASARDPWVDWGNPETLGNFLRTVGRHQYGLSDQQTFSRFQAQFAVYLEHLVDQWAGLPSLLVLLLAAAGLWTLFRMRRSYGVLSVAFLLFSAPVTTWLTDFDVSSPATAFEHRALVSVFYIPSYLYLAMLAGVGLYERTRRIPARFRGLLPAVLAVTLASLLWAGWQNARRLDMSSYFFTEDYVENLSEVVAEDGVVWANWDPFYFPLNYYQYVQGRRPDIVAIDQQLLRRSWYIQWLRDHYPQYMAAVQRECDAFLRAVAPFENKQPFNANSIQQRYIAMINAMIDTSIGAGRKVYFTYDPTEGVAARYGRESLGVATLLRNDDRGPTPVAVDRFVFRGYFDGSVPLDRMAGYFRDYYGRMMFMRGGQLEGLGDRGAAMVFYQQAGQFLKDNPRLLRPVQEGLRRLAEKQP